MFAAIGRWFKSLGALLAGKIDSSPHAMDTNADAVRAKYNRLAKERAGQIERYKKAVAALLAQKDDKLEKLKALTRDVEKLESMKGGVLAKARQRVVQLQNRGQDAEGAKQDEECQECLAAYNQFASSLKEKQDYIAELEGDIERCESSIKDHKLQLQDQQKEIERIKAESAEAAADIISAQQEHEVSELLWGLSMDESSAELEALRQLRREVRAEARVSRAFAGGKARPREEEFLQYAIESRANTEFEQLVGLAEASEAATETDEAAPPETDARLPE